MDSDYLILNQKMKKTYFSYACARKGISKI